MQALVSVAVITYNQKDYIGECIDSILSQDYDNIEIVVADDGSTDGTQELLKNYNLNYPEKINLILSETNLGITKNSNKAHFNCHGKYIAWIGGDDVMLPGKISKQIQYLENHPECAICYHDIEVFESESKKTLFIGSKKYKPHNGKAIVSIKFGTFNGACSTMVRTLNTPKNGFDERIPIASDWLYWVETLTNGGEIHYINEVLAKYRKHNRNITSVNNHGNITDHLMSCYIILNKYPRFYKPVFYRLARIYRQLAKSDKTKFYYYLRLSLHYKLYKKNILSFIIYILTLKKVKI